MTLHDSVLHEVVRLVIQEGEHFGAGAHDAASRVNVEYVSANPTGPMHVGHARGAAFGDALANLLAFSGRAVTREYYINDAGAQVDVLARSTFLRYREALGEEVGEVPEGLYPGDYLKPVGVALARTYGASLRHKPESYWLPIVRKTAIEAMMAMIRADLASLKIAFDVYASERALTGADGGVDQVKEAIEALGARDLIYIGRLETAQGLDDRGLGRPRADVVSLVAVWRRRRSAAAEIGRLLHLFRHRHRLSPHQDHAAASPSLSTSGAPTMAATSSA